MSYLSGRNVKTSVPKISYVGPDRDLFILCNLCFVLVKTFALFLLRHLHISAIKRVDNSDELLSKYLILQVIYQT